jgi:predicted carbohydrate-binding protein with CBM5 and CBM33 domain
LIRFRHSLFPILSNLSAISQLPQDGLGARVAPVRWALKDAANSYYTITTSSLRFVNKTDGLGYPLRISPEDGKTIVPADLKYTLARAAEAESEAAEKLRAQKAGEGMAEEDLKSALRTDEELNEKLISWRAGQVLRPHGKAWGTLVWKGK